MGRYVPNTELEQLKMLEEIGFQAREDLFGHIPEEVKVKGSLAIPEGMSELEVRRKMQKIAGKNQVFGTIFRGAGAYRHFIPSIVKSVISKENLLTAYTPYQAEVSQGILQSIFEYQTMICQLTGMDASNASVYDGATAAAEAVAMCRERKRKKAFISSTVHPDVLSTVRTYCFGNEMELVVIPAKDGITDVKFLEEIIDDQTACVYIQHPNYYGSLEPAEEIGKAAHGAGARYIMGVNPISLGIMKTPREYGADVAVGEGQPMGLSIAFGGPYLGFMACIEGMTRKLPGRIVGQTTDRNKKTGYVLTLQAREQHIRREKASSNVCSNQALCALAVGVYLAAMGGSGLHNAAIQCTSKAHYMAAELKKIGYQTENKVEFFHEFVTVSQTSSARALKALEEKGVLGGYPLDDRIVGQTTDRNKKTGYVLTLQAREQHIRREKASSNVCSNQALCALAVGVYLAAMGGSGLHNAAIQCTSKAHYMAAELKKIGYQTENKVEFFHEFVTVSQTSSARALKALEEKGVLGGYPLDDRRILWCCTEMNSKEEIDETIRILKEV